MSDTTDTSRTSSGSIKDITVYLTGFGAFARISDNPSSQISASFLPVGSTTVTTAAPDGVKYNIHLHPHPEPLKVSYKAVDEAVEKIWKYGSWDYILHLGVGLKGPFKLETVAYEKGYKYADVDGVDADGKKGLGKAEEKEEERGEGEMFATTLDVGYLVDFVKDYVTGPDGSHVEIEPSTSAGLYLCEYVYRASLMQAAKRGKDFSKRVLFMHVPPKEQPYNVETGIEVVKKLAEGMVRDGEGFKGHEETRNL